MDRSKLCHSCFEPTGAAESCPECGYTAGLENTNLLYLKPGTLLASKYLVGQVLGQGGFGITYLGWDTNLDVKLAIKEFFPQGLVSRQPGESYIVSFAGTASEEYSYGIDSFLSEAKTLAQFENHPSIVSVRDFFRENNTAYMVMSFVEGITFEHYLDSQGGIIPFDRAVEILMQVMDALREVHAVGFLHRDISPDNIMVSKNGRVELIDFGAAREEMRGKSKSMSVILKKGYAPEEQYRSRGQQGPWTDVYAVGATLYRAVTGKVPPEAMDRLVEETLARPSEYGIIIPPSREQALMTALAVSGKDRYRSIEVFQAELFSVSSVVKDTEVYKAREPKQHIGGFRKSEPQVIKAEEQAGASKSGNNSGSSLAKKILILAATALILYIFITPRLNITEQSPEVSELESGKLEQAIDSTSMGNEPDAKVVINGEETPDAGIELSSALSGRGNDFGNITNYGRSVESNGWIYYKPYGKSVINRVRTDGSEHLQLLAVESESLNVVGDWIFYSNPRSGYNLYRARIDGSERESINDDWCEFVNIVDGWAYYSNGTDGGKIYKMRIDGSERTLLNNHRSGNLIVVDDFIYYVNWSAGGHIYRMRIDGSEQTQINSDESFYLNYEDGWLYYNNRDDNRNIYKIRTDGTGRTKLNEGWSYYLNVHEGWVYYVSSHRQGSVINRIRTDGSNQHSINSDRSFYIQIVNGWIYYERYDPEKRERNLYKMRFDGSERQQITS